MRKRTTQGEADHAAKRRPEDIGAIWFLELELATDDGDVTAARAAQAELERLGWDVRRRPRLGGRQP